jgi:hypothetical protein
MAAWNPHLLGDAVLGAARETSALPADRSPNLQSTNQARIRLSVVYSLTAFIRLHAVLGGTHFVDFFSACSISFTRW